jgi:hypothetical protein
MFGKKGKDKNSWKNDWKWKDAAITWKKAYYSCTQSYDYLSKEHVLALERNEDLVSHRDHLLEINSQLSALVTRLTTPHPTNQHRIQGDARVMLDTLRDEHARILGAETKFGKGGVGV